MSDRVTAVRGDLVFCTDDPRAGGFVHVEDGIVVSRGGERGPGFASVGAIDM